MSDGPPRGIRQSMTSRRRMNSTAASRLVSVTSCTASAGSPTLADRLAQDAGDDRVRRDRPGRAPQEGRVARLEAQAGGVGGDVGTVLVDDRHHAEGHTDPPDAQPVGTHPAVEHLARPGRPDPATWRSPPAIASTRPASRRSRSTTVAATPSPSARSTSTALAARISSVRATSRSAPARSASSFTAVDAVARAREASLARRPSSATATGWATGSFVTTARLPAGHREAEGSRRVPCRDGPPWRAVPRRARGRTEVSGSTRWRARVAGLLPRRSGWRMRTRALGPRWQPFVTDAVAAEDRYLAAVRRVEKGPLKDRLEAIGVDVATAVEETWRVAAAGQDLDRRTRRHRRGHDHRRAGPGRAHRRGRGRRPPAPARHRQAHRPAPRRHRATPHRPRRPPRRGGDPCPRARRHPADRRAGPDRHHGGRRGGRAPGAGVEPRRGARHSHRRRLAPTSRRAPGAGRARRGARRHGTRRAAVRGADARRPRPRSARTATLDEPRGP